MPLSAWIMFLLGCVVLYGGGWPFALESPFANAINRSASPRIKTQKSMGYHKDTWLLAFLQILDQADHKSVR